VEAAVGEARSHRTRSIRAVAIHAVVRDEESAAFLDLGRVALEWVGELGEAAVERDAGLDVLGVLNERGLPGLLDLLLRAPDDVGLPAFGGVAGLDASCDCEHDRDEHQ